MFLIAATLIVDSVQLFFKERMAVSKSVTKVELLSCTSASVYYLYTGRDNSICYSSNCYIRRYRDEIRVVIM